MDLWRKVPSDSQAMARIRQRVVETHTRRLILGCTDEMLDHRFRCPRNLPGTRIHYLEPYRRCLSMPRTHRSRVHPVHRTGSPGRIVGRTDLENIQCHFRSKCGCRSAPLHNHCRTGSRSKRSAPGNMCHRKFLCRLSKGRHHHFQGLAFRRPKHQGDLKGQCRLSSDKRMEPDNRISLHTAWVLDRSYTRRVQR